MDYAYAASRGNDTVVYGIKHLNLSQTLDNGQAFRWKMCGDAFEGVAHGRLLRVCMESGNLVLCDTTTREFETLWRRYFSLERSYGEYRSRCEECGGILQASVEFAPGLRLLQQSPWEVLISFILSQNCNIPRIKKMIEALCENFGQKIDGGYAFPSPARLAILSPNDLDVIKCGYRAPYLVEAARLVSAEDVSFDALNDMLDTDLHRELCGIRGVGPKVAECIMLFGFGRIARCPLDVWMKRVMQEHYSDGLPPKIADIAGIAQQFLFYFVRNQLGNSA